MFLNNKYTQKYYLIINKYGTKQKIDSTFERHHIFPKSMGGKNNAENLIYVSPINSLYSGVPYQGRWLLERKEG